MRPITPTTEADMENLPKPGDALHIIASQNGYVVSEGNRFDRGQIGREWTFERWDTLVNHITDWARGKIKRPA